MIIPPACARIMSSQDNSHHQCIYISACINGYIPTEHLGYQTATVHAISQSLCKHFDVFEGMLSCSHPSRSADDRFKKFVLECHMHGLSYAFCANRCKEDGYSEAKADDEPVELTKVSRLESAKKVNTRDKVCHFKLRDGQSRNK